MSAGIFTRTSWWIVSCSLSLSLGKERKIEQGLTHRYSENICTSRRWLGSQASWSRSKFNETPKSKVWPTKTNFISRYRSSRVRIRGMMRPNVIPDCLAAVEVSRHRWQADNTDVLDGQTKNMFVAPLTNELIGSALLLLHFPLETFFAHVPSGQ